MSSNFAPALPGMGQTVPTNPAALPANPMGTPSADPSQAFGPATDAAAPAPYNGPAADAFQPAGNPAGAAAGSPGEDAALQQLLAALGQQGQSPASAPAPEASNAAATAQAAMPAAPQDPTQQLLAQLGGQGAPSPAQAGQDPTQQLLAQLGALGGNPSTAAMPGAPAPTASVHEQMGPNGENWILSNSSNEKSSDGIFNKILNAVKTPVGMAVSAALVIGTIITAVVLRNSGAREAGNDALKGTFKNFKDTHKDFIEKLEASLSHEDGPTQVIKDRQERFKKAIAEYDSHINGDEDKGKLKSALENAYEALFGLKKDDSLTDEMKKNAQDALDNYWNGIVNAGGK